MHFGAWHTESEFGHFGQVNSCAWTLASFSAIWPQQDRPNEATDGTKGGKYNSMFMYIQVQHF